MNPQSPITHCLLAAALLAVSLPDRAVAKSYSSGGRSYSSSSSRSSSSGGRSSGSSSGSSRSSSSAGGNRHSPGGSPSKSGGMTPARSSSSSNSDKSGGKSFKSSSGKSYSAGSTASDDSGRSYTSAKSYTSSFSFDKSAARARKEEASKQQFTRFKESSLPKPDAAGGRPSAPETLATRSTGADAIPSPAAPSYRVKPAPLPSSASGSYRRPVYVPDPETIRTRPARTYTVFYPYISRPFTSYRDPYNGFFWWWLLDRTVEDRALWAYHHRYNMDTARYQALVADNQHLEERVAQLEEQQVPRDPNYVPPGLDRDLMYSDRHLMQAYSNRPTTSGRLIFWTLAVPLGLGAGCFFTWLLFFKRWQTCN